MEGHSVRGVRVKFVIPRSKTLTLKKPDTLSQNQRTVFKAADLIKVLQRFEGKESQGKGVGVGLL